MKRGAIWIILTCLIVIPLVLTSCNKTTTATSTSTSTTTSTTTTTKTTTTTTTAPTTSTASTTTTASIGNWWDSLGTPQYGGTLNLRMASNPQGWDYWVCYSNAPWDLYVSTLANMDPTVNPDQWNYKGTWAPRDYTKGDLAQSWEVSQDMMSVTFHLKQGVHWALGTGSQASRLVNGRELTSADVVYTFSRMNGLNGFKASSWKSPDLGNLISVTAPDKYTVTFTFNGPSPYYLDTLITPLDTNGVLPQEVIQQYGDMNSWQNVVGTGPYILTDYVSGGSGTYVRNPNYFNYDERHPQNQLPYVETINYLIIPDSATALAAVRTGKIDIYDNLDWSTAATVKKTNPQILQVSRPTAGYTLDYRDDKSPFTDIRVRQAIQESIDLPTLATTYYGNTVDGIPVGETPLVWTGWYTPYSQWPQSLKDQYSYNPTAAKKLLADAGYPNGFKTDVVAPSTYDLNLLQVYKSYLAAIGIDMTINVMDYPSWLTYTNFGKQDQMIFNQSTGILYPPLRIIARFNTGQGANPSFVSDPAYDTLYNQFKATGDLAQQKAIYIQADMYAITHFFHLNALPTVQYALYQPWLKGFLGEQLNYWPKISIAHWWLDQNLKKSMGY